MGREVGLDAEPSGKSDLTPSHLHEVEIEDLLPRDKIEVDMNAIGVLLEGKKFLITVLITGAAGSIGSEMVRQVARFEPAEMVLIDQAETPMHDIRLMMSKEFPQIKNWTIVTSIANQPHMERIFAEHCPDYVFHAAAYKHVPMMEDNRVSADQELDDCDEYCEPAAHGAYLCGALSGLCVPCGSVQACADDGG